jgi:formiminotetrahydrofolate cyclodeaminase
MIAQDSVAAFLDRLASKDPTPGGGSAAAIMGAMGAALVSMVCNVSIGKKGLEGVDAELRAIGAESERLRAHLTALIAEDVAVFGELMAAYRLPKAAEAEKAQRAAIIQHALRRATDVPLECARGCAAVIALAQRSADVGFRGVVSDAGVGALAALAALRSAALNVHINAPSIADRSYAAAALAEIDGLVAANRDANETVHATVLARISG